MSWVARTCAELAASNFDGFATAAPRPGALCLAQFSADDLWYRGFVESVSGQATKNEKFWVYFVDFGNSEAVPASRLKPLAGGPPTAASLAAVAPLAAPAELAYLRVPQLGDSDAAGALLCSPLRVTKRS